MSPSLSIDSKEDVGITCANWKIEANVIPEIKCINKKHRIVCHHNNGEKINGNPNVNRKYIVLVIINIHKRFLLVVS